MQEPTASVPNRFRIPARVPMLLVLLVVLGPACQRRSGAPGAASAWQGSVAQAATPVKLPAVPTTRPRIWWTPERIQRGKAWLRSSGFRPREDQPRTLAMYHVLTGDRDAARTAIKWLLEKAMVRTDGVSSDEARWLGEDAMLVFDGCYDQMTAAERKTVIERWNGYIATLNRKSWGGVGMEGNNYYWGYLRNGIEWALTTFHENPQAAGFLEHALNARWAGSFLGWAAGPGKGGVLVEGTQYGSYLPGYASLPLASLESVGLNLWDQTEFFKEAVYYLIYATTPAATARMGSTERSFELFPFNDDEQFRDGGSARRADFGGFVSLAAEHWRTKPVGQYARRWLDMVKPQMPAVIDAGLGPLAEPRAFDKLPLDYFAPGTGFVYARTGWSPGATVLHLQLGKLQGVGHEHVDWGTFQMWRGGRWLTRESTSYGEEVAGWKGNGKAPANGALGHNTLLFDGFGPRNMGYRKGPPVVQRLESRAEYTYAAVDITDIYRIDKEGKPQRDDNPLAARVVREFVFVRPLETLLVFDRITANAGEGKAGDVVKTFVWHSEEEPRIEGRSVLATFGDQALRMTALLPAATVPRVVKEGSEIGQFRIEVDASGSALTHMVHTLQARGAREPDVTAVATEDANVVTVTLTHPSKGKAQVEFRKGGTSREGRIGFAAKGEPALVKLRDTVQGFRVGEEGPVWQ